MSLDATEVEKCLYGSMAEAISVVRRPVTRTGDEMSALCEAALLNAMNRIEKLEAKVEELEFWHLRNQPFA